MFNASRFRVAALAAAVCLPLAFAANVPHHASRPEQHLRTAHPAAKSAPSAARHSAAKAAPHAAGRAVGHALGRTSGRISSHATVRASLRTRHVFTERFRASSFTSEDLSANDVTAGEDPVVRAAAVAALGSMNGTAVVIDPSNGRILAMVNQPLALSPGAEPCSTIKITVAMAALSEGLVTRDTPVELGGFRMNMTDALAHSNNLYFEELGRQLGFERVHRYAKMFGLGELAGYNIPGEQLGVYPDEELSPAWGGVGRMCSFGQSISLTPLQLGAYVAALANGGTLYYLQHPTSPEEVARFEPRVKRQLDIARYIPEIEEGMASAVEFGTARSLRASFNELPVFGKTGTCSDKGTRFGWFASFSQTPRGPIVSVFFLEGGRPTFGPKAAELTGVFYRNLWDHNWFHTASSTETASISAPVTEQP